MILVLLVSEYKSKYFILPGLWISFCIVDLNKVVTNYFVIGFAILNKKPYIITFLDKNCDSQNNSKYEFKILLMT